MRRDMSEPTHAEFDAAILRLRALRTEMDRLHDVVERGELTHDQFTAAYEPLKRQVIAIMERVGMDAELRDELLKPC